MYVFLLDATSSDGAFAPGAFANVTLYFGVLVAMGIAIAILTRR